VAFLQYTKPDYLNQPLATDDDPSNAYTPPPIIQQPDDLTPDDPHFSNFQSREDDGTFNGPPVYPPQQPTTAPAPTADEPQEPNNAPDTQGIDPAVAANLRVAAAAAKDSPSTFLANAARKRQPTDERLPDGRSVSEAVAGVPPPFSNDVAGAPGAAQPIDASTSPAGVPVAPSTTAAPATAPTDLGPGGGGQPVSASDAGPPPNITDKRGRPIPNSTITDPLERATEYKQRLSNWEPTKAKGWMRYVAPMLQGWAAGQRGSTSPWSGMGGAITGALTGQFKPTLNNEQWKDAQLKETQDAIDQQVEQQKNIAGVAHTIAETKKLNSPTARPKRIVKDKNGIYRPIDTETGRDENGNLVEGETQKSVGGFKGWTHDADGVAHFYENGQDTGRLDPGRNKVKLADGRLVDASQSYTAELTAGREGLGDARANEAARQENAQIDKNIAAANAEKTKVWAERDKTDRMVTKQRYNPATAKEETYQDPNPLYDDLTRRGNALDDDIRRYGASKKPIVAPRPNTASPSFATPPVGGYTEQQVRDRWKATPPAKRVHKTADDAVAAARVGGLIPPPK
jgi:hypothetical protein